GEDLVPVAEGIIDEADLICFVVTNNNQQASEFEFLKKLRRKGKPLLILLNVQVNLQDEKRLRRFLDNPDKPFSSEKRDLGGHIDRIQRDAAAYYGTADFPIVPVQLLAAQMAQRDPGHEHASALMKASRLQHFLDSVRLSLLDEGLLRRSQNLLGSTVADIEGPLEDLRRRAGFYGQFGAEVLERAADGAARMRKATDDHARQLDLDIRAIFAAVTRDIDDFAEDHWDDAEEALNEAWRAHLANKDIEGQLRVAQEKALAAFSGEVNELLDEIGRELLLQRKLSFGAQRLDEQDSSVWFGKTLQWGSSLAGLGMAVAALANWWNPAGWVWGAVAVVGFLASLFESKASKRRKAVAKITQALGSQVEQQSAAILGAAVTQFREQCEACAASVHDYFRSSAEGLAFVGRVLGEGAAKLETQRQALNTHFAARILDFAKGSPSQASADALRARIGPVEREVGQRIDIAVQAGLRVPSDLARIEAIIQEQIHIQIQPSRAST
ncbi:MAG: hypothetical protein ACLGI6_17635, partial [Gammaproteobacteria bacterium]